MVYSSLVKATISYSGDCEFENSGSRGDFSKVNSQNKITENIFKADEFLEVYGRSMTQN